MESALSVNAFMGFREPFGSLTHLMAAVAAVVGWVLLVRRGKGNSLRIFSLSVFSFSMVFLFSMSGVYHIFNEDSLAREVFQRLDHAAIWILITGTFTPIHTLLFRGVWRWGFLAFIWSIAITGLVLEVVFFRDFPEWLSLSCYLALGWMGVLTGWKYAGNYGLYGAKMLIYGGLSYSAGGILEYFRWPTAIPGVIGPHEMFHLFVIGGAWFHWTFIFERAGFPVINQLMVEVIERPGPLFIARIKGERHQVTAATMEQLKLELTELVVKSFPQHVRPQEIVLRLQREDLIELASPNNLAV